MPIRILEFSGKTERGPRVVLEYGGQILEAYIGNSKYLASPGSPIDAEIAWDNVVSCRRMQGKPQSEGIVQVNPNLYRVVGPIQTPIVSFEDGSTWGYGITVLGWESISVTAIEFGGDDGKLGEYVEVLLTGLGFYPT